jgi:hypothetical protein
MLRLLRETLGSLTRLFRLRNFEIWHCLILEHRLNSPVTKPIEVIKQGRFSQQINSDRMLVESIQTGTLTRVLFDRGYLNNLLYVVVFQKWISLNGQCCPLCIQPYYNRYYIQFYIIYFIPISCNRGIVVPQV